MFRVDKCLNQHVDVRMAVTHAPFSHLPLSPDGEYSLLPSALFAIVSSDRVVTALWFKNA